MADSNNSRGGNSPSDFIFAGLSIVVILVGGYNAIMCLGELFTGNLTSFFIRLPFVLITIGILKLIIGR